MNKIYLVLLFAFGSIALVQAKSDTDTSRIISNKSRLANFNEDYHTPHHFNPLRPKRSKKALGGGWVAGKGHGYAQIGERVIYAKHFYELDGSVSNITTTGVYITEFYGELGLGSNLELSLHAPLFFRIALNSVRYQTSNRVQPGDQVNSMGDITIGLKYALIKNKPFVLSTSLVLGIPSGVTNGGDTQLLQTGDGEFNQMIRLDAGYSFHPFYLTADIGFNNRTNGFSDEIRANFEIGMTYKKWIAMIKAGTVQSLNNGTASETANGLFSNNIEYITFGPALAYMITKKFGVNAGVGFAVAGQNVLADPAYNAGLFLKF